MLCHELKHLAPQGIDKVPSTFFPKHCILCDVLSARVPAQSLLQFQPWTPAIRTQLRLPEKGGSLQAHSLPFQGAAACQNLHSSFQWHLASIAEANPAVSHGAYAPAVNGVSVLAGSCPITICWAAQWWQRYVFCSAKASICLGVSASGISSPLYLPSCKQLKKPGSLLVFPY